MEDRSHFTDLESGQLKVLTGPYLFWVGTCVSKRRTESELTLPVPSGVKLSVGYSFMFCYIFLL